MAEPEKWGARWALHTPDTLRVRARELGGADYLIKGLVPAHSIGILVGDSGLGKSPLMYQAGLCVATGIPFLGRETRKGRVLMLDFENGLGDMIELVDRLSRYLGLSGPPEDLFHLWSLNDCQLRYGHAGNTLLDMLRDVKPRLAIIDSLSSYRPKAEELNSDATAMLQEFRILVRDCGTAVLLVHHRRKQPRKAEESAGALERANLRQWFQDSRGASALINGVDVRLGADEPDLSAREKDDLALVLRGFGRIRGEIGPLYLARDCGEDGEPEGYRPLTGPELLFDEDQQKALAALPTQFTFKDAKKAYGRSDQPTRNWLVRCVDLGLLRQPGRGVYQQLSGADAAGDGARGETS
jgi:AAA domain